MAGFLAGQGATPSASFVSISLEPGLSNERRLVATAPITLTDGGANGDITIALTGGTPAPVGASYLVIGLDATLTAERRLQVADGISLTDGGANADATLGLTSIKVDDGTSVAPSIAFRSNTGTGFYKVATGRLGIVTSISGELVRVGRDGVGGATVVEIYGAGTSEGLQIYNGAIATGACHLSFRDQTNATVRKIGLDNTKISIPASWMASPNDRDQQFYVDVGLDGIALLTRYTATRNTSQQVMQFQQVSRRDASAAGQNGTGLYLTMFLENSVALTYKEAVRFEAVLDDVTNTTEDSHASIHVQIAGTLTESFRVTSPGDANVLGAIGFGSVSAPDVSLSRGAANRLDLATGDDFNLVSGVLKVANVQVVSAQGAAVADAAGGAVIDAEARTALNALLARVRAGTGHGLIAA